jgi:general secretion pathway protein G
MNSRRKKQEGFTLIEIMVVILILGLLATLVVQSLRGATDKAKRTKAMADIAELKTALDRYYIDMGSYPTSDQGLPALVNPGGAGGQGGTQVSSSGGSAGGSDDSYIQRIPNDPWGNPYVYTSDGSSYTLKSYGADGAEGGTGKNADIDASQF